MAESIFTLDLNETFPRLSRPPIVEAVIHWQARAQHALEPEALKQTLATRLPNYPQSATLRDYLRDPPTCPSNLPLEEFVYQNTFSVPGHPFGIRVIKVMQPSMPELLKSSGLFLDIDVFSTTAIPNESGPLDQALTQMRWLKNKVFFSLLTDAAVQSFTRGGR